MPVAAGEEGAQVPVVLDEAEHARELPLLVADLPIDRVRADHEEGNAEAEPHPVDVRRRNVIVEPAVVVPRDEDRRVLPHLRPHDRVDDLGAPVLTVAERVVRVIGQLEPRRDPGHRRERVGGDVAEQRVDGADVLRPPRRIVPVPVDRGVRGPDVSALSLGGGVVRPGDVRSVEQVSLGREVEARTDEHNVPLACRTSRPSARVVHRNRRCSTSIEADDAGYLVPRWIAPRSCRGGSGTTGPTPRRRSRRRGRSVPPNASSSGSGSGGAAE